MNKVPLMIFLVIFLVLIDSSFGYLGGLSLSIVVALIFYGRTSHLYLFIVILLMSLSNDVSAHLILGGTLLCITISMILFVLGKKLLPLEDNVLIKIVFVMFILIIFHLLIFTIFHISSETLSTQLYRVSVFGQFLKLTLVEILLYIAIQWVADYVDTSSDKTIRLK